jgi:hypothetical protein
MTSYKLLEYILKNKNEFKKLGITINEINSQSGDRYSSEDSTTWEFKMFGHFYRIGYVYVTEDGDDLAQAECYNYDICERDGDNCKPEEVFKILDNYQQFKINLALEKIGI